MTTWTLTLFMVINLNGNNQAQTLSWLNLPSQAYCEAIRNEIKVSGGHSVCFETKKTETLPAPTKEKGV